MGLDNHRFGAMRSQILNSESMTDIDRIYAQAVREERHNTIIPSLEAKLFEAAAFHAGGSRYVRDPNKTSCSHCGKLGHDKASCWENIRYPTDHQGRRSSRGNKGRQGSTSLSAMANSAQLNLISPTSNVGKAEEEFQGTTFSAIDQHIHKSKESLGNSLLTKEVVNQLFDLFKEKQAQDAMTGNILHEPKLSWILDSGSSHHMTSDSSVIENLYHLKIPLQIRVPNGDIILVQQARTVHLAPNFILHNVLYALTFTCNLISVRQLTEDLHCVVTCSSRFCLIQAHTLKRLIGVGELRNGVYYLKGMAHKSGTALIASSGSDVPPYFSDVIITDETHHVEPRERMSTSRVESTQHAPKMNEPRSEVNLEINTMTHGETEAMTLDGVVDHELAIAPHREHGVTNENEEKEDELQEQVVMDVRPKRAIKMPKKLTCAMLYQ
ncbi:hypothetical protein GH714_033569 [Hevea brasiliensis]|uniref:Retrovirus-related Pol polyprotein from transposon TNT 1-94-like beta-barrel domain-containing protein n=1 Tax=Hevea brasiliensis TaxID=3981 RepID=A0A6A6NDT8_HEVBR|nr:hypothetical protein GH714_033569 [Hevea brasiliensis]